MRGEGFRSDQDGDYIEVTAGDILDFGYLWDKWLQGDTIINSQWSVPDGLTLISGTYDSTTTAALISINVAAPTYTVTNTVQTAAGLRTSRSFRLIVEA